MRYVIAFGMSLDSLCSIFCSVGGRTRRLLAAHLGLQHLLVHALDGRYSNTLTRPVVVNCERPVFY
jgi:hypothetical protein